MHVVPDPNVNWFVQFIISIFVFGLGFVFHRLLLNHINTFPKFSLFQDPTSSSSNMVSESCAVCNNFTKKRCSRCKIISYCSEACQRSHWISEHKAKCNELKLAIKTNSTWTRQERNTSSADNIVHHSGKVKYELKARYGDEVDHVKYPPDLQLGDAIEEVSASRKKGRRPGFLQSNIFNTTQHSGYVSNQSVNLKTQELLASEVEKRKALEEDVKVLKAKADQQAAANEQFLKMFQGLEDRMNRSSTCCVV